ncbi:hypothetical protein IV203_007463 [Nitzschia inconspicua]|uniref:Uncharacterized protein n=1 Tax=Nitzschia inconspicua TaxID=303405 RepID=A0A9K3PCZ6_9STRA|nr:hypothetical protein IV203_007463 [Nitzschia inconspicua]
MVTRRTNNAKHAAVPAMIPRTKRQKDSNSDDISVASQASSAKSRPPSYNVDRRRCKKPRKKLIVDTSKNTYYDDVLETVSVEADIHAMKPAKEKAIVSKENEEAKGDV